MRETRLRGAPPRDVPAAHPVCNSDCGADWDNCSWTQEWGGQRGDPRWATDVQSRKRNARARHLGGSNFGFADGRAKWLTADAAAKEHRCCGPSPAEDADWINPDGRLEGRCGKC